MLVVSVVFHVVLDAVLRGVSVSHRVGSCCLCLDCNLLLFVRLCSVLSVTCLCLI